LGLITGYGAADSGRLRPRGKLAVESMLTHVLPLSLWQEGIALAKNGQACKVIYHP